MYGETDRQPTWRATSACSVSSRKRCKMCMTWDKNHKCQSLFLHLGLAWKGVTKNASLDIRFQLNVGLNLWLRTCFSYLDLLFLPISARVRTAEGTYSNFHIWNCLYLVSIIIWRTLELKAANWSPSSPFNIIKSNYITDLNIIAKLFSVNYSEGNDYQLR